MTHQSCRSCGAKKLVEILDLGFAPPSNALLSTEHLSKGEIHYPLVLIFCEECKLVQTRDFHSGEALFTSDYPYLSSTSTTWIKHSHDLVDSIIQEFHLTSNSLVAEIASNDGYLLERLAQRGIPAYGIEPTKIAADISVSRGHSVINNFLTPETASSIKSAKGAADIVLANNVFAHVPKLAEFTQAAKSLLKDDGILIIEVQYFAILFEKTLFDTIYHEHFSYFTLTSLNNLLQQFQLGIFKVEQIPTHGGSIRVYARNNSSSVDLEKALTSLGETEMYATELEKLSTFQGAVDLTKTKLKAFFLEQQMKGKIVAGLGAAAKGNTLINFLGLSRDEIRWVFDSAPSKHGKFLPGSHIPVHPLTSVCNFSEIDIFVILAWNIANELAADAINQGLVNIPIYRLFPRTELVNGN